MGNLNGEIERGLYIGFLTGDLKNGFQKGDFVWGF